MLPNTVQIDTVVSEMFSENTFIAHLPGRTDCIVIDPGLEPIPILEVLEKHQLEPAAILNTHGHADHIAGNATLKKRFPDSPLAIGAGDADKLTDAEQNLSAQYGMPIISPAADLLLHEGETLSFAGFDLEVLETPGHSCGHIVFVWKGAEPWIVFGGDVLFAGSIGRTDFPDGSMQQLVHSIHHKLFPMPADTIVLTGHGPATTIGQEKATNPFVGAPAGYQE
ncbi:MAG TPA: MBL fold metallo-hydrolase [Planctomycetaceae bacterium]|nr:MBL fold metallo-hydrolase [Blastopirellula sp.]HAY83101.1 MBL fold metallo-hydrolase [Planctomycetaceae bacterium]|tara:strand:- start:1152 stop:1823 length:672 start_codon:yes stop_codon:yes gene_type:complete